MALDLSDAILEQLAGPTVRAAALVRFDFKSGERRYWPGFSDMDNGEIWTGVGNVGRISQVSAGPGQAVEELTLSLFGNAAILANLTADAEEAVGRECSAYLQFFELDDWSPIASPIQFFWGRMGPLFIDRQVQASGSRAQRTVSTRVANAFINRRRPPFGFYSDRDQKARTDGTDNFFIHGSSMASATVNWPDF